MGFFFENIGTNTFLTYQLAGDEKVDTFNYGMMSNNSIENVISPVFLQESEDAFLRYNISSKISLNEYFSGIVQKKRVIRAFSSIADAVIASEEYMLDPSMFVLDEDYIFVDVSSGKVNLINLPILGYDNKTSFSLLLKKILFSLKFDDSEDSTYVAEMISYINSISNFSMIDFKNVISKISESSTYEKAPRKRYDNDFNEKNKKSIDNKVSEYPKSERRDFKKFDNTENHKVKNNTDVHSSAGERYIQIPENKVQKSNITEKRTKSSGIDQNTEKITFLGLMRNFSKERLSEYKKQKAQQSSNITKSNKNGDQNVTDFAIPNYDKKTIKTTIKDQNEYKNDFTEQRLIKTQPEKTVNKRESLIHSLPKSSKINFGQTEYWDSSILNSTLPIELLENDSVTPEKREISAHLIRKSNGESVEIKKFPFKIGKEKGFVDYFIKDNMAISGCHAFIYRDGDDFMIKDTNSTNHVYINGQQIENGKLVTIEHQDIIRLANEDFEFKKY